jgi:hypothetical protein
MFRNLRSIQHIHLMPVNSRRGPAPASFCALSSDAREAGLLAGKCFDQRRVATTSHRRRINRGGHSALAAGALLE